MATHEIHYVASLCVCSNCSCQNNACSSYYTGVVIGFSQTAYEVSESEPLASVHIELVTGTLRKEVIIIATISGDTALGMYILQVEKFL